MALLTAAVLAAPTLSAQQGWSQSPQYPGQRFIQTNPNYVSYPQGQPQAYQQQSSQQYAQPQQYAQQPAYADPGQDAQQPGYAQPQQAAQPFAAEQLEQLVAPIALYPDALVAQILAASTYPAQVISADNWIHSMGNASPEQIAYGADAQANWDPSVKALTAFPQVLDLMNHDLRWTTDLGNAYYNQPQDVLQTIQLMRQRAQQAGTLQSTPQEAISYNQGYIQLAPVSSQDVYVPAYDPWTAYGQPVSPYPGFSLTGALQSLAGSGLLRNGLSFAMSAFSNTQFGWAGWALNWLTNSVLFHQSPYTSQSTSVARFGGYGGSYGGGINRTPNGWGNQSGGPTFTRPPLRGQENLGYNRGLNQPGEPGNRAFAGSYARPALPYTYRPQSPVMPARPQAQSYGRPNGYSYGSGYNTAAPQNYGVRQAAPYDRTRENWRAPSSTYQRNEFAQHSYAEPRSYSGNHGHAEAFSKPERSGGSHFFGSNRGEESFHSSYKAPKFEAPKFKAPKAPKMSGGGFHGGGGGHHGGGGGHSGGGFFGHGHR
jgi:uncharacterized membrane protein YgcG